MLEIVSLRPTRTRSGTSPRNRALSPRKSMSEYTVMPPPSSHRRCAEAGLLNVSVASAAVDANTSVRMMLCFICGSQQYGCNRCAGDTAEHCDAIHDALYVNRTHARAGRAQTPRCSARISRSRTVPELHRVAPETRKAEGGTMKTRVWSGAC